MGIIFNTFITLRSVPSCTNSSTLFKAELVGWNKRRLDSFRRRQGSRFYLSNSFGTATSSRKSEISKDDSSKFDPLVEKYLQDLKNGCRASLASAITLVETEHKIKKKIAQKLLSRILQEETDGSSKLNKRISYRIGLSGPPGAGKSSFIEVFGKFLTQKGHKVAVLAVDPSSATTGGSLLGDKTRMPELTRDPNAYIRPSPARGHLGGVTRSTNEAIVICEYSGYDIVIIETIGVGQSEYAVTNMVDIFVLLLPPGGGDELQGIKRGIIERADIILVTKSDGDLEPAAHRTQYEYMAALKFMRNSTPNWKTKVQQVSAKTKTGIDKFWDVVNDYRIATKDNFLHKRSEQRKTWMWTHIQDGLYDILLHDPNLKKVIDVLSSQVEKGEITPGVASDHILSMVVKSYSNLETKQIGSKN